MSKTLAALLATALVVGCNKKEEAAAGGGTAEKTAAAKTGDKAVEKAKEAAKKIEGADELADKAKDLKAIAEGGGKELTLEQYEKLMVGLAACEVTDRGIDRKCEAWKAFDTARRNRGTLMKGLGGKLAGLGQKHIKHESPAVRIQAANLMSSVFGASKDSQATIIAAAREEKNPVVLKQMLRAVGSSIGKNEDILKLVMDQVDHENERVRMEVVTALTSTWAKDTEGTLDKAMEIVEKDKSDKVKQYACRRLGQRGDEKVLPLLEKLTKDPKTDPKMYAACMKGLIAMWSSPITHDEPSKKAYDLTLKRLKAKPRDENNPPWTAMSSMHWAKQEKFQEKAKWFKKDELIGVLGDIVADRDANWMARTGAIDTMKKLGADKAIFEKHKTAYAEFKDKPGVDKHVYNKLEKAITEAQ